MEQVLGLSAARVVFADYPLIQHDFPELSEASLCAKFPTLATSDGPGRRRAVERHIDEWLLRHCAYISRPQAMQEVTNTAIPLSGSVAEAFRPPRYGRAFVTPLREGIAPGRRGAGLFDLKGCGVAPGATPRQQRHSNGLLFLGLALTDLVMQWIIDTIFAHAAPSFWSVPVYGVLDLGFDVNFRDKPGQSPAGLLIRRAHRRPLGGQELPLAGSPDERVKFEIESILRAYGLSSANPFTCYDLVEENGEVVIHYGGKPLCTRSKELIRDIADLARDPPLRFEGVNIQLTRESGFAPSYAQLVDFGHYVVLESCKHPVLSMVTRRRLYWGHVVWPDAPHFVRPVPELRVPYELWGLWSSWPDILDDVEAPVSPLPQVHARCFRLANMFRAGKMDRADVLAALRTLLAESLPWLGTETQSP